MVLRLLDAYNSKPGSTILWEGEACTVKANDVSKTGKHGASKCRIEALGIISGKKKIIGVPGDHRFEVPNVEKHRAQVLSVTEDKVSVMDLDSFESLDLPYMIELKGQLVPEQQVEYWDIEGVKTVMRIFT